MSTPNTVTLEVPAEKAEALLALLSLLPDAEAPAAPTKLRRNAAGRLVDEQGRFVKEDAAPKAVATKKATKKATPKAAPKTAPKAPAKGKALGVKLEAGTIPLGKRGNGLLARRSAHRLANIVGVPQRELAQLTIEEAVALATKVGQKHKVVPAASL